MARLVYALSASLDGYVNGPDGTFGWAVPDEQVHTFINERQREIGTFLLGRRMYETMLPWERPELLEDQPAYVREFAGVWAGADRVVHSTTLEGPVTARTRIERRLDVEAVRSLKSTAERDLCVAGPGLAAQALRAGLVDECHVYLVPVLVGGGTRMFPDGLRLELRLCEERRFRRGTVFLRYRAGG